MVRLKLTVFLIAVGVPFLVGRAESSNTVSDVADTSKWGTGNVAQSGVSNGCLGNVDASDDNTQDCECRLRFKQVMNQIHGHVKENHDAIRPSLRRTSVKLVYVCICYANTACLHSQISHCFIPPLSPCKSPAVSAPGTPSLSALALGPRLALLILGAYSVSRQDP